MSQDHSFTVRDYQPGDEKQILELYRLIWGPITERYWRWRYLENPYGKSIIKLMFFGDQLAGQYAIQPMDIDICGRRTRACFSLDTMTHPAHRGKGIFTELAERAYADATESGFALVYGFPNRNSFPGFTSKLGWRNYGNTREHYLILKEADVRPIREAEFSEKPPREVEPLWNALVSRGDMVGVPRDSRFLKWRFSPDSNYVYQFEEMFDTRGNLRGYAATKQYQNKSGHVVDIVADQNDTVKDLLCAAIEKFRRDGLELFTCWLPPRLARGLTISGLSERSNDWTYFCFRAFQELAAEAYERDSWFLTMADSDVY